MIRSYFKPLLLLAGLAISGAGTADDVDVLSSVSGDAEIATQSTTLPIAGNQDVLASPTRINPGAMLVPHAYRFSNAADTPAYYAEARANYCRAARSGDANGFYALGWLYSNGRGVTRDLNIAAQLYARAAELGHSRAQEVLAIMPVAKAPAEMPACLLPDPPSPVETVAAIPDETVAVFNSRGPIFKLVEKLAPRYQIDANLAMAFIAVESGFDSRAVSPRNAQGLMQLIPETAQRFQVKNAFNAEDNIRGGLAYLQWLLAFFRGDVRLVAAAYNAGERTVEKYKGVPPYPETQSYVRKIAALYKKPSHPFRDDLVKASSFLDLP